MTKAAEPEQTHVNDSGTRPPADARLTRGRSGPVLYELIDVAGNVVATGAAHLMIAEGWRRWPDHDDELNPLWDVRVVGCDS